MGNPNGQPDGRNGAHFRPAATDPIAVLSTKRHPADTATFLVRSRETHLRHGLLYLYRRDFVMGDVKVTTFAKGIRCPYSTRERVSLLRRAEKLVDSVTVGQRFQITRCGSAASEWS